MSCEDEAFAELWEEQFQQPLPMLGDGATVRRILTEAGMSPSRITAAIARAQTRAEAEAMTSPEAPEVSTALRAEGAEGPTH